MSEYWKSTPKYWCKHCSIYVRDTKLERTNHEATAKHQSALKRFLRDLHRGHDQELREKDRAKREIERLNGVVGGPSSSSSSPSTSTSTAASASKTPARPSIPPPSQGPATNAQRQKQWEQLAELGVDVPTELRRDMAMAGEWTVTNMRVIEDSAQTGGADKKVEGVATGVRKRARPEGDDEEEDAERKEEDVIKGLFKKPKKWGRDSRQAPENDADLDALLSTDLVVKQPKKEEQDTGAVKKEETEPVIKKEEGEEGDGVGGSSLSDTATKSAVESPGGEVPVKKEEEQSTLEATTPAVVFKKRKPKNIRQK
ncbi:hypothetical protein F4809DRAFT_229109 [Biscogniauxia mediterranea]|nr:hypothetical protein F4809DRAFT_229109 [Biscogniauxia mediterranea]